MITGATTPTPGENPKQGLGESESTGSWGHQGEVTESCRGLWVSKVSREHHLLKP